jgi:[ribosomal protein S5]-alanine N-acetyltransferase
MKIKLRPVKIEDANFTFEMKKNKEFRKHFPEFLLNDSLEQEKKLIKEYIKGKEKKKEAMYVILANEEKVGSVEIYKANLKHKRGSIGYSIKKEFWRKGVGTEACELGLKKLKSEFGLHSVEATTHPKNIGSQKVLEKNGFQKIGLMKDYYKVRNKYVDRLLYWKVLE